MNESIEQTLNGMVKFLSDLFEKAKCPKCQKSAVVLKINRRRVLLRCPYCDFDCEEPEELRSFGIEPEIEI